MNLSSYLVLNVHELKREGFILHSVILLNFCCTFSHTKWLLLNITLKNKEKLTFVAMSLELKSFSLIYKEKERSFKASVLVKDKRECF
jgi:hypothetical protein